MRHILQSSQVNSLVMSVLPAGHISMVPDDLTQMLWRHVFFLRIYKSKLALFSVPKMNKKYEKMIFYPQFNSLVKSVVVTGILYYICKFCTRLFFFPAAANFFPPPLFFFFFFLGGGNMEKNVFSTQFFLIL